MSTGPLYVAAVLLAAIFVMLLAINSARSQNGFPYPHCGSTNALCGK